MKKRLVTFILSLFIIAGAITTAVIIQNGRNERYRDNSPTNLPDILPQSEEKEIEIESFQSDLPLEQQFVIPLYNGEEIISLNNNIPCVSEDELVVEEYIQFSELDSLGRCGPATACIGKNLLAKEPRGSIGMIKPTGWHTVRYDFIDGYYLYNRCHLIAYELCGVNADERNLITGTRYLNINGMLAVENQVFSYISSTENHVFYRVTPQYNADNLLASGVQIEAYSIEDHGIGLSMNVFCFNVQPGVIIDYSTGDNYAVDSDSTDKEQISDDDTSIFVPSPGTTYIINTNTRRFHLIECQSVQEMKDKNRVEFSGTREELIEEGYIPCGRCHP